MKICRLKTRKTYSSKGLSIKNNILLIGLFFRHVLKLTGVLYEDSLIQIGYKLESKSNLARLVLFYGNKSRNEFNDFQLLVSNPGALSTCLMTQVKPMDPVVASGAQVQQVVHFICIQDFYSMPVAKISFNHMYDIDYI